MCSLIINVMCRKTPKCVCVSEPQCSSQQHKRIVATTTEQKDDNNRAS